jgi:hypothetical protein
VAKKRAYAASRSFDGKMDLLTFSQAESLYTATVSSSHSAQATSLCVSRTPGKCEYRSSRRRLASEAVLAAPSGLVSVRPYVAYLD